VVGGLVADYTEEIYPEYSRLLIRDETGEAGLAFRASFNTQMESVNSSPDSPIPPECIRWPVNANDHIRIVGATSGYETFYEDGPKLTIRFQPYSSVYAHKNGKLESIFQTKSSEP
jgi:hypothetical protein